MFALCLVVLILSPAVARADSFALTSGFVDFQDYGLGNLQLISGTGPQLGFGFWGALSAQRGGFFAPSACFTTFMPDGHQIGTSCAPGSTASLAANWSGEQLPGYAIVNGVGYETRFGSAQAGVMLSGSVVLPVAVPFPPAGREIDAPFTLTGFFDHPGANGMLVHEDLIGQGTARVFLTAISGGSWAVSSVLYDISPTPEPMSVLLLGSGIAGLALRRRRFR
jgi:hypothetical protein